MKSPIIIKVGDLRIVKFWIPHPERLQQKKKKKKKKEKREPPRQYFVASTFNTPIALSAGAIEYTDSIFAEG